MIGWFCDECGCELKPGPRPMCRRAPDGVHRVSERQLELRAELARMHLAALERGSMRRAVA